jgi:hypothetical protein
VRVLLFELKLDFATRDMPAWLWGDVGRNERKRRPAVNKGEQVHSKKKAFYFLYPCARPTQVFHASANLVKTNL